MNIKYLSRQNLINLFVSLISKLFPNKKTIDKLSESDDGELLYNGEKIGNSENIISISSEKNNAIKQKSDGLFVQDLSSHALETMYTESGAHGLRYYDNKLQYFYNDSWNNIATGNGNTTIITDKDIILSPNANNALVKYSNGYYVQSFMISQQINNAIVKYSDGYYVPKIPINNATTDDIDAMKDEIDEELIEQQRIFNEKYDIITTKIKEISSNTTKSKVHEYSGNNSDIESIIDISTLYDLSSNVILNLELMIVNNSDTELLTIKILENDIETLNDTLTKLEVQKYKLPNITNIEIFIKGNYQLFLYVNYV